MTKPILPASVRDANFKMTERERRKAIQVMAAFDAADAEFRAARKKLAKATCDLKVYAATKIRPELARYVAEKGGPVDAYGDVLYGVCKCGQLVERYLRGADGERIGMGFITDGHVCKRGAK